MSQRESSLSDALRMLAEAGPREAPDHVEAALKEAFRRQRGSRRLHRAMVGAIVTGAVAAGIAAFLVLGAEPVGRLRPVTVRIAAPTMALVSQPAVQPKGRARVVPIHKPTRRQATDQLAAMEFVPLPYGDDALVGESARIVRVELPRSALRMAGFSVAQERANDRVQADVVLGADGLAHAVRFVRYTE
jgi:hypothetical protein